MTKCKREKKHFLNNFHMILNSINIIIKIILFYEKEKKKENTSLIRRIKIHAKYSTYLIS